MNPDLPPPAAGVFAGAVQWLQGTLLGSVATVVAIIAVASVGFLLLSGRIEVRRGARVIFGCFILFGASSIAAGIMRAANGSDAQSGSAPPPPPPPVYVPPIPANAPVKASPYDPYAGAALPSRP